MKKLSTFDIDNEGVRSYFDFFTGEKSHSTQTYGDYCDFEEVVSVIEELKKQLTKKDVKIAELEEEVDNLKFAFSYGEYD